MARALALDGGPVVLADIADNTGGGAGGDTTEILRELLRVGAQPDHRGLPVGRGGGARLRGGRASAPPSRSTVGGKVDPSHGAPVTVTGRVRTLSDGRFVYKGPMFRGLEGRRGPHRGAGRQRPQDHPHLATGDRPWTPR